MTRRRSAAQMQRLVTQWRASGEPQARFARRHGMRPWTLCYWSRKVATLATATPTFVPVQVTPPPVPAPIEVVLPDGLRVVARADTPATTVAAMVAALRAAC